MARTCREARGRVRSNVMVRDMHLQFDLQDGRRLEVVVDNLQSTQRWCVRCTEMAGHSGELRWSCIHRCKAKVGDNVPRTSWTSKKGPACCHRG